jgi:hypothetical protein
MNSFLPLDAAFSLSLIMGASCCLWTSDRYSYTRAISGVLLCQSSQWRAVVLCQGSQRRALVLYQGGQWCAVMRGGGELVTCLCVTARWFVMCCCIVPGRLVVCRSHERKGGAMYGLTFSSSNIQKFLILFLFFLSSISAVSFLSVTIAFLCLMQLC